jgi:signal transduction histidine kinase
MSGPINTAELRNLPLFAGVTEEESRCLQQGEEISVPAGHPLTREGEPADYFYVILEGEIRTSKRYDGQEVEMAIHTPGRFFGEVPLLLEMPYVVDGRARKPCRLLRYSRDAFWLMMRTCPSVATEILRTMAIRIRALERYSHHREKLVSLGTMAAGLAHELNNPASAARRAAAELREAATQVPSLACCLTKRQLSPDHAEALAQVQRELTSRPRPSVPLDPVAQSDREDAVTHWLKRHGMDDAWTFAAPLVTAGIDLAWLEEVAARFPPAAVVDVLRWIAGTLTLDELVQQVDQSTTRIAELVNAVKAYSYEGRAPLQEVDVHDGLESTLTMLSHKLKGVTVTREYDRSLPRIQAYGHELNQVWTNLIDNAIDAVNAQGQIWIRTRQVDGQVVVDIQDNGLGIPMDIRSRLFEPFFTTKEVAKGTGLGLLISHRIVTDRHGSEIEFESQPGDTRFSVRLPITQRVSG